MRRELYLLALYRTLEAALLALAVFGPLKNTFGGEARDPALAVAVAATYLVASAVLLLLSGRRSVPLTSHVVFGVLIDIAVATLATHALPFAGPGIAMMLLFNVGAAALLLPLHLGLAAAALASGALVFQYVLVVTDGNSMRERPLAEVLMFSVSYLAMATLTNLLGRDMRESRDLAQRRGAEAANLAEVNELIIRRMRVGVLMVDGSGRIRMANEAARILLGESGADSEATPRTLPQISPALAMRVAEWRRSGQTDDTPLTIGDDGNEVLPRFTRLLATDDTTLIFLDDTALVSRRAESLTLAAMGRFSASLAHEIRNPLAAISYATQLLEESRDIGDSDRRLLQIVHQQCLRTNAIVESVLGLARRERAQPENVDLVGQVRAFIDDYRQTCPEENASLRQGGQLPEVPAMVDPRHLQQVLTSLANNAVRHGHQPGEAARIIFHVDVLEGRPVIEVTDRGPGIPDAVSHQLFRPFFTTSEQGTGLGLYIAHELCRANDGRLEYVSVPGGGACFRITLRGGSVMLA
ncbi:ATP-binding protein [Luteimonas sp. MC1750]|uniref:sensor histidine kinase n=1 Tax=Luteimonas sp. MC1750 TaxID=2799326 RepID=UPI0018F09158|nr:ATP-binding protein [Luteimonas sp. MC1750]MBJ6985309.1 PAS domain-containing protein [Luteimonas sp. MC1750]QQO07314.1 PAS domain-containing protein [Luteimonas sp. MC1750]